MSRIGKRAIPLNDKVKVEVVGQAVQVTGPRGTLAYTLPEPLQAAVQGQEVVVTRGNDSREARALHGLARSLINNMVTGVVSGFRKELEIRGVGYRAQISGNKLQVHVGFSAPVEFEVPPGVKVTVIDNVRLLIEGAEKQQVGQVAATIRSFRPPEVYKGKGIRYIGEYVIQKEGKTV